MPYDKKRYKQQKNLFSEEKRKPLSSRALVTHIGSNRRSQEPAPNIGCLVGTFIQTKRDEYRWSLTDMSTRMPMHHSTLENIERGYRDLTLKQIARFAELFGYESASDMLRDAGC
jgi:ribosome-binding protein aMBF1 (putative translation factor)